MELYDLIQTLVSAHGPAGDEGTIRDVISGLAAPYADELTCDALVTIGLYSLFYNVLPFSLEVDQSFIAAVLTIVGYTVNDKVVIFDRIRENVRLYPSRDKGQVINDAINATLSRTFSTAMSTLVVLIAIFIFGGETIRGFVFAILFGVIMGTYSSIFIASPVVYEYFLRKQKKDEEKALAAKKK